MFNATPLQTAGEKSINLPKIQLSLLYTANITDIHAVPQEKAVKMSLDLSDASKVKNKKRMETFREGVPLFRPFLSVSKRNKKSTESSCTSFCHFTFLLLLIAQEMSEKSRSQGRSFWLESHQVARSPAVCLPLSLEKLTSQNV